MLVHVDRTTECRAADQLASRQGGLRDTAGNRGDEREAAHCRDGPATTARDAFGSWQWRHGREGYCDSGFIAWTVGVEGTAPFK